MIGVAALALALAFYWYYLPWLRWRIRVERIIAEKLVAPSKVEELSFAPTYQKYNGLTGPEYQDILRDPRYVAELVLQIATKDSDSRRRVEAFWAIRRLLVEASSPALAREFVDRVLRRAVAGTLPSRDEQTAVSVVIELASCLGLDDGQRAAILARARQLARGPDPDRLLPFWVSLIGQVGGTAESEFLLELDDSHDPNSFTFGQGSPLMHSRLPVLLEHVGRWIDNPARALGALDYTILPCTADGRRLLLEIVLAPGRDLEVRRKAMRLLKRDCNGFDLLLRACEQPDRRRILGQLYGPDSSNLTYSNGRPSKLELWAIPMNLVNVKNPDDPRPELRALRARPDYINFPWPGLIDGMKPANWGHVRTRMLEQGKTEAEADRGVQEIVLGDMAVARELAGRDDLSTPAEWQRWFSQANMEAELVTLGRWVESMHAHPDLMQFKEFTRFIDANHSVEPELLPVFARLAHAAPPGTRWRLCQTLLLYSERTEEVPLLIDDIEQEVRDHPARFGDRNTRPTAILRDRFGVNHFWDVAAWRRWWSDYEAKASTRQPGRPS